jgi:HAE1 family hydrophobic/amphiphilic exporter-1
VSVVEVSIEEVIETLVIALVLVILVVFLFLQSWRATLIPLLAIPVSIIGTFIFFIPLGFTINTLTLFGFVLAIGIVVDDAIVVVEAVQHYIDEEGLSPREATIKAMKDISGPVIAIALILAAVFVPVGFIPGIVGRLYQQFAVTIAISVLISAFVALSLTPALCTLILRPMHLNAQSKGLNQFFYRFNGWFARLAGSYTNGVRRSIRATPLVLVLLVCICVATVVLFGRKPSGFIPQEDEGRLYITFQLPEAASTGRTVEVLREVMREIEQVPGHCPLRGHQRPQRGHFLVQVQQRNGVLPAQALGGAGSSGRADRRHHGRTLPPVLEDRRSRHFRDCPPAHSRPGQHRRV